VSIKEQMAVILRLVDDNSFFTSTFTCILVLNMNRNKTLCAKHE
jgi:hypothetical protein